MTAYSPNSDQLSSLTAQLPDTKATDPELFAMKHRLAADTTSRSTLDVRRRHLLTLAVLDAIPSTDDLKRQTESALADGVSALDIREALYQCVPYIGFPRTEGALRRINAVFLAHGIALPLEQRSTVTEENRFEKGLAVQKHIFGNAIDTMHATTPEDQKALVVDHLSSFCFGDVYTRSSLDLKDRELLTFTVVSALGGCESQLKSHVLGNTSVGNSRQELIDTLELCLPLIGFPRTLNALACINAVLKN